ncbi:Uba4 protein [Starmerella bacillaris]|uniref:Uba4 protein n=1 Tax=Starmerella bacillaris TaxID=1247836 RepID=A0AAV5RDQ7_STABA|nr:Uba4 protein [Starmerella bacillaris]
MNSDLSSGLELDEYSRYGRQMLVPEIGLEGQLSFKESKVIVIGAGGLGCPCIAYLAGAGIGQLAIVDPDVVETSNLHRQVLHSEEGLNKAESLRRFVSKLNPKIALDIYTCRLTTSNASIISKYDIVVDCTDNVAARYLINDICVLMNKPLVTASALRLEGQLTILNYKNGPCYRCLFPRPPAPELSTKCAESGVLGSVVGVLGTLQASQVLKLLLNNCPKNSNKDDAYQDSMILFSLFKFPQIKQVRIRPKQKDCQICSADPLIKTLDPSNYEFPVCAIPSPANIQRIKAEELKNIQNSYNENETLLIDCREPTQFGLCSLKNFLNIPYAAIQKARTKEELKDLLPSNAETKDIIVICRRGNDSILATEKLQDFGYKVKDVAGGLLSYSNDVDHTFPIY